MGKFFSRLNHALYKTERLIAGILFLAMVWVMFISVTHRVFSREEGRLSGALLSLFQALGVSLDATFVHGPVSTVVNLLLAFVLCYGGLRTMKRKQPIPAAQAVVGAAVLAAGLAILTKLVLVLLPNGIVWGPVAALCCMLWIGFLGAAITTYEKRHLALEVGDKVWPQASRRFVRCTAMLATAVFMVFLLALSLISLSDHRAGWLVNHLAGNLLPTPMPKWVVFVIFPYTFGIMFLRFCGAAASAWSGEDITHTSLPTTEAEPTP